jgi:hypothetical protein
LVLDEAPEELVRLVGYLEAVTEGLLIDLVTVASYDIAGSTVIVPQRVEPERSSNRSPNVGPKPSPKERGRFVEGVGDFASKIELAPEESREVLNRLTNWAISLEHEGLVKLGTFHGTAGRWTLLPRLIADNVGLVTIWNDGGAYLQFWRSVFERRAPKSLLAVDAHLSPQKIGQGNVTRTMDDQLLKLLTDAYREAAGKYSA